MTKIWQRYFFFEVSKTFGFFLFCFFLLYALIDYSTNYSLFNRLNLHFFDIILHYMFHFLKRLGTLLPLAMLLATIRVLLKLNLQNELIALLTSGIHIRKLFHPFLLLGLLGTSALYLNAEYGTPRALTQLQKFEDSLNTPSKRHMGVFVNQLLLPDDSIAFYHSYDSSKEVFFDFYWIRSKNEIFHVKYLYPYAQEPIGRFIELFKKNPISQQLELKQSWDTYIFKNLKFEQATLSKIILTPKMRPLSLLWDQLPDYWFDLSDKNSAILTAFLFKILMPWSSLLAVLAPLSYCIQFSRQWFLIKIYGIAIFGFVIYFTVMNSCYILGENLVLHPLLIFSIPLILLSGWFTRKYFQVN